MTQHNYTKVIDMTDSEAFYQGFYDDVDKVLFLTFKNGSVVSRLVPENTTPEDVDAVNSWGQAWHSVIKAFGLGPEVAPGDEFVFRSTAPFQREAEVSITGSVEVPDEVWEAFVDSLVEQGSWDDEDVEDSQDELLTALAAALAAVPQEEAVMEEDNHEPAEGLSEAVRNSEGTFLGIGFVNVPQEVEQTLTSAIGFFNQFVQESIGEVQSHIERYDTKTMREFFRGLR